MDYKLTDSKSSAHFTVAFIGVESPRTKISHYMMYLEFK